jgi:ABC-type bacteriocin/lantibiotic exporter with double-glycine peptidase domain
MSAWVWIAIVVAIILLIVLIILFSTEKGKNKKSEIVKSKLSPAKIVFISTPQTIKAGSVSETIKIQIQDANANPANITSSTVITLKSSSGGIFSTYGSGLPIITTVTINAGADSATFYYKDSTKGNPTIIASSEGLVSGTQTEIIN